MFDFVELHKGWTFAETLTWLAQRANVIDRGGEVARYPYRESDGRLLFYKIRMAGKRFILCRPDGSPGIRGIERVLYRLPELVAAPREAIRAG